MQEESRFGQPIRIKCEKCGCYYTQTVTNPSSGCLICKTKGIVDKMQNKDYKIGETCPACRGTKIQKDRNGINVLCSVCNGKGKIYRDHQGNIQR